VRGRGKGKGKAVEEEHFDLATEVEAASQMVDRVTGKNAPRARAPRAARGKEVSLKGTRQTRSRKAKDKGKEKEQAEEEEPVSDEDQDMDVYEG